MEKQYDEKIICVWVVELFIETKRRICYNSSGNYLGCYEEKGDKNMLSIGIKGRQETVVTEEKTAEAVGSGALAVYATPAMIANTPQMMARMPEIFRIFLLVSNDMFFSSCADYVCNISKGVCASLKSASFPAAAFNP